MRHAVDASCGDRHTRCRPHHAATLATPCRELRGVFTSSSHGVTVVLCQCESLGDVEFLTDALETRTSLVLRLDGEPDPRPVNIIWCALSGAGYSVGLMNA